MNNQETRCREHNDRLALVPVTVPRLDGVRSVFDVHERTRTELERFFLETVAFEGKGLKILGWGRPQDAEAVVRAWPRDRQAAHA